MHITNANAIAHGAFHASHMGHTVMHPAHANPIFQRHDFQNRRSASEPAHELQMHGGHTRSANTVLSSTEQATNNPNHANDTNHKHGDDCNYVDCLQKITTVKVRCLPTNPKHTIHTNTRTLYTKQETPTKTQHNVLQHSFELAHH